MVFKSGYSFLALGLLGIQADGKPWRCLETLAWHFFLGLLFLPRMGDSNRVGHDDSY